MASYQNGLNETTVQLIHQDIESLKSNVNQFFLIIMGSVVLILQLGFALYDSAMVRPKNVTSASFRNYVDIWIGILTYFLIGYALAFGEGNGFCGTKYFALIDLPQESYAMCFFQYTFAAAATTIPGGVVHERCSTTAYVCYTVLLSGFIYPIATHWAATDEGWLHFLGFDDFAFSGVVHALGGAASLAAAYMAGPRSDRFQRDGTVREILPHSIPQGVLGSFVFFLGIIAFNCGSQLTITNPEDRLAVGIIVLNTLMCTVACAITGLLHERYVSKSSGNQWYISAGINGSFVGMVVICAGCNQMSLWAAFFVGVLAYYPYLVVRFLVLKLGVDDVVDGIPIHIGGGYFALLATALFKNDGVLFSPSKQSVYVLLINAVGGIVIMLWAAGNIVILYLVLRHYNLHRASVAEEELGLDQSVHGEIAYRFEEPEKEKQQQTIVHPAPKVTRGLRKLNRRSSTRSTLEAKDVTWQVLD